MARYHKAGDNEIVSCPTCGMTWFTRALCSACAFRSTGADPNCEICHGTAEAGLTKAHTCPEPLPYEMALMLASMGSAHNPAFVSQTMMARIKLGLNQGP